MKYASLYKYTDPIREYIANNYHGVGPTTMSRTINQLFGTSFTPASVKAYYHRHGYDSGIRGGATPGHAYRPPKGRLSPALIAARFRPGQKPANAVPVGTIRWNRSGYYRIKTATGWRVLQREVWGAANGPIPEGYVLIFLDGNSRNVTLNNLQLISRAANMRLCRDDLRFDNPEQTRAGALISEIRVTARDKERNICHEAKQRHSAGRRHGEQPQGEKLEK